MADVTNDLIYEVLTQIQGDTTQIKFDLREVKHRPTGVEEGLAGVNRRMDRLDHIDRIERRVGLVDNPLP